MKKKNGTLRFLFLGDIVGEVGGGICRRHLRRLRSELSLDGIIVNGENSAASGKGITAQSADSLLAAGVDVITTGNHIWRTKEFYARLDTATNIVRPANYPSSCPGKGYAFFETGGVRVAVLNLLGRVFFKEHTDCPFKTAESILLYLSSRASIIFIDFHAEASSEKQALGLYLDGKVTGVLGTHTHVQTSDERLLPNGTAFITDLGLCGSLNSCLGFKKEPTIGVFLTQMPHKFQVDEQLPYVMCGAIVDVDGSTGKAIAIERFRFVETQIPG